jgi:putative transposase
LICRGHRAVALENVALRQQLAVFRRTVRRPQLRARDRLFWVLLAKAWPNWRTALIVVQPDTVVRWHRQALKARTSRPPEHGCGYPGARRQDGCRQSPLGSPSQPWRTDQAGYRRVGTHRVAASAPTPSSTVTDMANVLDESRDVARIDGFLHRADAHGSCPLRAGAAQSPAAPNRPPRDHRTPTAAWTAQQVVDAFPYDSGPRWLVRDRDAIYGDEFRRRVAGMGVAEVIAAPSSPWQNPFAERLIGSLRRECLDHVIILSQRHLRRVLARYVSYYHGARTHLALEKDAPTPRRVQASTEGPVVAFVEVGGLHHRYERRVA